MTVKESIAFLRKYNGSLFYDNRLKECAYNLEIAYETLYKIRSVAGLCWKELCKTYQAHPNEECRLAQNALSEVFNMTGWATNWEKESFNGSKEAK